MKEIKSYLLEDNEPEISPEDKKAAQKFISSLIEAFILDKGEDGSDEDLKEFVKDSLGGVPEDFLNLVTDMCIETKKKIKTGFSKIKESADDKPGISESLWKASVKAAEDLSSLYKKSIALIHGKKYYDPYTDEYYKTTEERNKKRDEYLDTVKFGDEMYKAHMMGSSDYKINGKIVSQKEYDEWLKVHPKAKTEFNKETLQIASKRGKEAFGGDKYEVTHDSATTGWYRYMNYGGAKKTAIVLAVAGAAAIGTAVAVRKMKKDNEKMIAGVKVKMEKEQDPETREDYNEFYNNLLKSMYNDSGKIKLTPDTSKIPNKDKQYFNSLFQKSFMNKELKASGEEYIKNNGSDFLVFDRKHLNKSEFEKDEVVKTSDGTEIHARRKKSGHGMTYVRMRGGEEVGYATKDEFRAARQNEGMVSLRDALMESFEI